MKSGIKLLTLLGAILVVSIQAPSAYAQASRTWVSGVGDDANPCSRTAPCKTFAGAISKTAAGGEIDVLDPGGFGGLTITKAITLDGGGGEVASVLVAGTNGITVVAGASDVVTIRNLRINGVATGLNGIQYNSGAALFVENCEIFSFTQNGVAVTPSTGANNRISIANTTVFNNTQGGIQIHPSGGTTNATLTDVHAFQNGFGIGSDTTAGGTSNVQIARSTAANNIGNGVQSAGSNSGVQITESVFVQNNNGVSITSPGTVLSFGNNIIAQNITNNVVGTLLSGSPR